MALTKCKSCQKEVDIKAKTCPHCGVADPGITFKEQVAITFVVFAIIGIITYSCSGNSDDTPSKPKVSDIECVKELSCWGERHHIAASVHCPKQIEKLAKYSHEWTDGMLGSKFSHYRWLDKQNGVLTYIGDKIKLQNGFGAWQPYVYECDFDPRTNKVLDVRASAGRI